MQPSQLQEYPLIPFLVQKSLMHIQESPLNTVFQRLIKPGGLWLASKHPSLQLISQMQRSMHCQSCACPSGQSTVGGVPQQNTSMRDSVPSTQTSHCPLKTRADEQPSPNDLQPLRCCLCFFWFAPSPNPARQQSAAPKFIVTVTTLQSRTPCWQIGMYALH